MQLKSRKYDFTNGQKIAAGAASVVSAATNAREAYLFADGDCFVNIGQGSPSAANDGKSLPLAAKVGVYVRLTKGDVIAAIQSTAACNLYIIPII